ncbi:MAG TPA: hypothetical protein VGO93_08505 [Candidatus Xenobia bacterium]|jgi:enterochelin esterase-like enzyme
MCLTPPPIALADRLRAAGVKVTLRHPVGGHDMTVWEEELTGVLLLAFGGPEAGGGDGASK